jgi:tocopherol O-methyltransferase
VLTADPASADNAAIARHYDSLDSYYRDLWGEHVHHGLWLNGRESARAAVVNMSRRTLAALALTPDASVADIGCGYGATARLAAEEYGARVVGLTLSPAQKRYADRHGVRRGEVEIRLRDWREEEFPPNSLDALFALESLEHMPDKAAFARMARNAVRPGGRVMVATWLAAEDVTEWQRRHLLDPICREGRLAPLATFAELRGTFADAGFAELEVEDLSRRVRRTWTVVLQRLAWRLATRPDYWRFLLSGRAHDAVFALTAMRIRAAYRAGCFRYGFFVWE